MLDREKVIKNIWIMGDVHGDWLPIRNFYMHHKNELSKDFRENILIILGDFGGNFYLNKKDDKFKDKIEYYPLTYFVIRGNHEERPSVLAKNYPSDWHKEKFFGNTVWNEDKHPRILYALDQGGEYEIAGKSVLVIPGAYSVDKWYRIQNHWSWFPEEQLNEKEQIDILNNLKPHYDYILSHTCPHIWHQYINDLFLSSIDQSQIDYSMEDFLNKIAAAASWQHWYWGHYHDDRDIPENATMLYHLAIPFGYSINDYQKDSFLNN